MQLCDDVLRWYILEHLQRTTTDIEMEIVRTNRGLVIRRR